MNWVVFLALMAALAHLGLNILDVIRGRTGLNGARIERAGAPKHFWGTLVFYAASASFLFLLSVRVEAMQHRCGPQGHRCEIGFVQDGQMP